MKTICEAIGLATKFLHERGVERARRLSEEIFAHVLHMKRLDLYLQFDRPMNEEELANARACLVRCGKKEPLQYVLGETDFFGCPLRVDSRALIPRQETEILASLISKKVQKAGTLWDVCTGSGCLGLSLKKAHPELEVVLSDLSKDALDLACTNAEMNQLSVELRQGDLFAPFEGEMADWIVCNPPYVTEEEWHGLDTSVRDFEPKMALVAENRGLMFYERIALQAPQHLKPKGCLWLEIGSTQKEAIQELFETGSWAKIEAIQDWSGRDRFFFLEKG